MSITEKVISKAMELIDKAPAGKRYSQLVLDISSFYPDFSEHTIHGSLYKFKTELPENYYQPRGVYTKPLNIVRLAKSKLLGKSKRIK